MPQVLQARHTSASEAQRFEVGHPGQGRQPLAGDRALDQDQAPEILEVPQVGQPGVGDRGLRKGDLPEPGEASDVGQVRVGQRQPLEVQLLKAKEPFQGARLTRLPRVAELRLSDFNRERPARWVSPASVTLLRGRFTSSRRARRPTEAISTSVNLDWPLTLTTLLRRSTPTAPINHLGHGGFSVKYFPSAHSQS